MKIGFLGNTNNYPFTLAYELKRAGHDVIFLVDRPEALHRPESKYPEVAAYYGRWIFESPLIRPHDVVFGLTSKRVPLSELANVDLLVLNGFGPAVFADIKKPKFVIITGADLDSYADSEFPSRVSFESNSKVLRQVLSPLKRSIYRKFVAQQRRGISQAQLLEYSFPGLLKHGDRLLDALGVEEEKRCWFLLADTSKIEYKAPLNRATLRLFCMARLNWCEPFPAGIDSVLDNKRTDILLHGISDFIRRTGHSIEVRMVRKGLHVAESMELAAKLKIDHLIHWLDEMTHDEFYKEIVAANVVSDHFGQGVVGLGVRDALAAGRPVLVNESSGIFHKYLGEDLPILSAASPEDISRHLESLGLDFAYQQKLGQMARVFAEKHCSPTAARLKLESLFASGTQLAQSRH